MNTIVEKEEKLLIGFIETLTSFIPENKKEEYNSKLSLISDRIKNKTNTNLSFSWFQLSVAVEEMSCNVSEEVRNHINYLWNKTVKQADALDREV